MRMSLLLYVALVFAKTPPCPIKLSPVASRLRNQPRGEPIAVHCTTSVLGSVATGW
jgi:hypothetical protein